MEKHKLFIFNMKNIFSLSPAYIRIKFSFFAIYNYIFINNPNELRTELSHNIYKNRITGFSVDYKSEKNEKKIDNMFKILTCEFFIWLSLLSYNSTPETLRSDKTKRKLIVPDILKPYMKESVNPPINTKSQKFFSNILELLRKVDNIKNIEWKKYIPTIGTLFFYSIGITLRLDFNDVMWKLYKKKEILLLHTKNKKEIKKSLEPEPYEVEFKFDLNGYKSNFGKYSWEKFQIFFSIFKKKKIINFDNPNINLIKYLFLIFSNFLNRRKKQKTTKKIKRIFVRNIFPATLRKYLPNEKSKKIKDNIYLKDEDMMRITDKIVKRMKASGAYKKKKKSGGEKMMKKKKKKEKGDDDESNDEDDDDESSDEDDDDESSDDDDESSDDDDNNTSTKKEEKKEKKEEKKEKKEEKREGKKEEKKEKKGKKNPVIESKEENSTKPIPILKPENAEGFKNYIMTNSDIEPNDMFRYISYAEMIKDSAKSSTENSVENNKKRKRKEENPVDKKDDLNPWKRRKK